MNRLLFNSLLISSSTRIFFDNKFKTLSHTLKFIYMMILSVILLIEDHSQYGKWADVTVSLCVIIKLLSPVLLKWFLGKTNQTVLTCNSITLYFRQEHKAGVKGRSSRSLCSFSSALSYYFLLLQHVNTRAQPRRSQRNKKARSLPVIPNVSNGEQC